MPSTPAYENGPFLRAVRRLPVPHTPIWLMRQAGRYMAEYRQLRREVSFLELCRSPRLCAEVMVHAVDRLGVDAAILFSDLLLILEPMGLGLEFDAGEGPRLRRPLRAADDLARFHELEDLEPVSFVFEAVRQTRAALPDHLPLIGFAGAPFTLASYAIEGGGSRNYERTKSLMYNDPGTWHETMSRLARTVARYLNAQIAAGAQAVQLFDSWVGCLGVEDYREFVLPHTRQLIQSIDSAAPLIHFGTGNPSLNPLLAEAGGDVIGVDWRLPLDEAWRAIGHDKAIQGNLEPAVLLANTDQIQRRAREILRQAGGCPGHIFNLGHGVLPQTPVENVVALVQAVHEG